MTVGAVGVIGVFFRGHPRGTDVIAVFVDFIGGVAVAQIADTKGGQQVDLRLEEAVDPLHGQLGVLAGGGDKEAAFGADALQAGSGAQDAVVARLAQGAHGNGVEVGILGGAGLNEGTGLPVADADDGGAAGVVHLLAVVMRAVDVIHVDDAFAHPAGHHFQEITIAGLQIGVSDLAFIVQDEAVPGDAVAGGQHVAVVDEIIVELSEGQRNGHIIGFLDGQHGFFEVLIGLGNLQTQRVQPVLADLQAGVLDAVDHVAAQAGQLVHAAVGLQDQLILIGKRVVHRQIIGRVLFDQLVRVDDDAILDRAVGLTGIIPTQLIRRNENIRIFAGGDQHIEEGTVVVFRRADEFNMNVGQLFQLLDGRRLVQVGHHAQAAGGGLHINR